MSEGQIQGKWFWVWNNGEFKIAEFELGVPTVSLMQFGQYNFATCDKLTTSVTQVISC